jgi:hypothetical protein
MISKVVRIGAISDQDAVRRRDVMAMTPSERVMCLIRLRDRQFGASACPVRNNGTVRYRILPVLRKP